MLSASNAPQPPSAALHPLAPSAARALDGRVQPRALALDAAQREHDLGGVVDVGVVDVGELERPAAGRELRARDRPVAADA